MLAEYVGLVLIFVMGLVLVATLLALHLFAGPGRVTALRRDPRAERLVASPHRRDAVRFYVIAVLFVVFDVETIFLFPWAVQFRVLGLFGLVEMAIFLGILLLGYLYAWRMRALEWV